MSLIHWTMPNTEWAIQAVKEKNHFYFFSEIFRFLKTLLYIQKLFNIVLIF